MARIGGRNTAASWVVGVLCAAVIGGLLWLSLPLVPSVTGLVADFVSGGR